MKKIIGVLPFIVLGIATWLTLTDRWIVPRINEWQAGLMNDNKYFPVLTIFILALPVLIILAFIRVFSEKKKQKP